MNTKHVIKYYSKYKKEAEIIYANAKDSRKNKTRAGCNQCFLQLLHGKVFFVQVAACYFC